MTDQEQQDLGMKAGAEWALGQVKFRQLERVAKSFGPDRAALAQRMLLEMIHGASGEIVADPKEQAEAQFSTDPVAVTAATVTLHEIMAAAARVGRSDAFLRGFGLAAVDVINAKKYSG